MTNKTAKALLLNDDSLTFTAVCGEQVIKSKMHGIKPVINILNETPNALLGAEVADRIVGKAAAMLFIKGRVKKVYACVISDYAVLMLEQASILYSCDKRVKYIINRRGDGMCPMEQAVLDVSDIDEAYEILKEKCK